MVEIYQFMVKHHQEEKSRWSYFEEYFKSRDIKKARNKEFDSLFVEKVNSGEVERAVDVRDKLAVICKAPKQLKKFRKEEINFEEAYERAVDSGADSSPYNKLKKFHNWLSLETTEIALNRTTGEVRDKIIYQLKKLQPAIEKTQRKIEK